MDKQVSNPRVAPELLLFIHKMESIKIVKKSLLVSTLVCQWVAAEPQDFWSLQSVF